MITVYTELRLLGLIKQTYCYMQYGTTSEYYYGCMYIAFPQFPS